MNAALQLQVISSETDSATRRLHVLMRQRDTLRPVFRQTWDALEDQFDPAELEAWATGVLDLAYVNAGPTCLIAYWDASRAYAGGPVAPVIAAAQSAADICREAGAQAATASLKALAVARRVFGDGPDLARWWRIMGDLARAAPESVEAAARRMSDVLAPASIDAFETFVASGLKAASGNRAKRLAFFSLQDELAKRLISRSPGGIGFAEVEREIKAFGTALWGRTPLLRSLAAESGASVQRRASLAGPLIRLPETYRGVEGDQARGLYRAAVAHAQAHMRFGGPPFPIGTLKPLQVALVTLIEDARVEWLAMRSLPGLRRLWGPWHVALAGGAATAPALMARLARALFDPACDDADGFVGKGRDLFAAALPRIADPAISREIGMLLGNDLGQMRVQFNAKTYVVEPLYRDDGLGLWDFGENAPPEAETLELSVDAARIERQERDDGRGESEPEEAQAEAGRARPVAPDERGTLIARYPEWDRAHGVERPDWVSVRAVAPAAGDPRAIEHALEAAHGLRGRIRQLVRGVRIGRTVRLNRQADGHDLDLDALLDAAIARHSDEEPDPRIFRTAISKHRDLSVLLMIDISESTRDRLPSGTSVLDIERLAVAVLAEAMDALGDPFSLLAFASDGRDDVRMTQVKGFAERYDRAAMARLAGLEPGLSTRLGTALRHGGQMLAQVKTFRKLMIVLTDGEPSDIDVSDPADLVEDARRAAIGLHNNGIDAFGVVLGQAALPSAARIFGRGNTMPVHRVEDLPRRLSELYFRLARR